MDAVKTLGTNYLERWKRGEANVTSAFNPSPQSQEDIHQQDFTIVSTFPSRVVPYDCTPSLLLGAIHAFQSPNSQHLHLNPHRKVKRISTNKTSRSCQPSRAAPYDCIVAFTPLGAIHRLQSP
uniref:Uncharacterized protein n=1 Tax=Heliothis virescens TaxID=7102 RepID=A0A2A4IYC6_HELVI